MSTEEENLTHQEEQDTDIVRRTLVESNGTELPITTRYVVRTIPVPTRMKVPLYENGQLISVERLSALGLTIREYTRAEVETAEYAAYYAQNPALAARVRQYSGILDAYGLPADAKSNEIAAAITGDESLSDAEKTTSAATLLALIHDIEINYNEVSGDGLSAWQVMPKLIRFLPVEAEEEV